jgi:hypothetical protein
MLPKNWELSNKRWELSDAIWELSHFVLGVVRHTLGVVIQKLGVVGVITIFVPDNYHHLSDNSQLRVDNSQFFLT